MKLWQMDAAQAASAIAKREVSSVELTKSVLERIDAVNPRINALTDVHHDAALATAQGCDRAVAKGLPLAPLHGVPVTVKVNVDMQGWATTGGIVALKDLMAAEDAPVVSNLRRAGAVIVGRSNTPCFSLRWFTDNDLHGRTHNPFNAGVTPGGSSGGAAAAVATGMGAIAHGNDYGGSIRHPAWACGVVGLRATAGRIAAFNATAKDERILSNQFMSVQGPLTRSVNDARLALAAMAAQDWRDPLWTPAPLSYADTSTSTLRVALFKQHAAYKADASVTAALKQAAQWFRDAGVEVDEVEPPHFEEASELWRSMVYDDLRRGGKPAVEKFGDHAVKLNFAWSIDGQPELDRDAYLNATQRRLTISRAWLRLFERYPILLMPISWEKQFPIDDDVQSRERLNAIIHAQSPLLCTAMMGLPGLAVPSGVTNGLPTGVQLVSWKFREDLLLRAGEIIERAAKFSALDHLLKQELG